MHVVALTWTAVRSERSNGYLHIWIFFSAFRVFLFHPPSLSRAGNISSKNERTMEKK